MILTLTANPTIDRVYYQPKLEPNTVHRATKEVSSASGKGVDVSIILTLLDEPTVALGLNAGHMGQVLVGLLDDANVPHDFVIEGEFNASARDNGQHGYLPRDQPGWYRKHFNIPLDWRNDSVAVTLRFNGVYHVSEAWLNGAPLALTAGSKSGYTSFTADIPQKVKQLEQQHTVEFLILNNKFGSYIVEGIANQVGCMFNLSPAFRPSSNPRRNSNVV